LPLTVYYNICYKLGVMESRELKPARLAKGLGQAEVAVRLDVSQAYVNLLENGKRRLTPKLARRFAAFYGLSADVLPVTENFKPEPVGNDRLAEALGKLGYPGFAYLRSHRAKKNPGEVLLTALAQESLDGRVAQALPWLALEYWHMRSEWLVDQARRLNLQNRLGFVVTLARLVSEKHQTGDRTQALRGLESVLNESRLVKEDAFYRKPKTEREKVWLEQNRPESARHWNLLADMRPEHLQYAG
jgi:transcriptional regulator with XRE-family HTH domain